VFGTPGRFQMAIWCLGLAFKRKMGKGADLGTEVFLREYMGES
jgi:hypothetical protein